MRFRDEDHDEDRGEDRGGLSGRRRGGSCAKDSGLKGEIRGDAKSALSPAAIASHLRTAALGRTIIYKSVTGSTNDDARRFAELPADDSGSGFLYPSGTLVLCETQTGGKGRLGRQWVSPAGGVFMSMILRPNIPPAKVPLLSLVAGYSVASAVRSLTNLDAKVKWPNDVLIGGKKICGILCEMRLPHVIAGIGINANQAKDDLPPLLRETASSIRILTGRPVDRNVLIADVLNSLEAAIDEFVRDGLGRLHERLTEIAAYLGQSVTLGNRAAEDTASVTGVFVGIDPDGRALIKIPGEGVMPFSAGDLSLRPS